MKEPFFNLTEEPWIKVMMMNGVEDTVSVKDLYKKSHMIKTLSGETPLQDNAILRLLIAISITCFYRYDEDGNDSPLKDEEEAIERFRRIWEKGSFPNEFTDTYLDRWHDRFFLIGGEFPFYQVPEKYIKEEKVKIDKKNPTGLLYFISPYGEWDKLGWNYAMTINGEVLQSANTVSPFANKGKENKNRMSLKEAARWIIYYMNYADCSSKIPGKWNAGMTFTSSGANIHPIGKNLFETIMLCSVLLDENGQLYPSISTAWETDDYNVINSSPYGEALPDNIPELYTQQSRKIILHYNGDYIDGLFTAAGDRYGTVNSFVEPMFAFHIDAADRSGGSMKPNHLAADCTGWKEYKSIFMNSNSNPSRWINQLFDSNILSWKDNIPFVMNDIAYGSMQCTVDYTVNTRISVNPKYFTDSKEMETASTEIDHISEITGIIKRFGQRLDCAYGAKDNKVKLNSILAKRLGEEYELYAGKLIERLLKDEITDLSELHKEEIKIAEKTVERILDEINIIEFIGHGEQYIGSAENGFHKEIYLMKKKLGIMAGEKNE